MPTTTGTIRFDATDFLAGLYAQYQTGINVPIGYTSNQLMLASAFHPYRFLGYAAPGFNATDFANVSVMTGVGRNIALGAESSTAYAYIICNDARLNRLDIVAKSFSNAGSWPHTIAGVGAVTGNDNTTYTLNVAGTSTSCVLYSYNDSGGSWDVGKFDTAAGTFDDDFMSTVPADPLVPSGNNKPHPMVVGDDDVIYIGDGNKVHAYDGSVGTDGTFYDAVYILPAGYIVTSFARYPGFLMIFAYYSPAGNSVNPMTASSGPAICVQWNYLDEDATRVFQLDDDVVTAGFEFQGTVGCFTQGTKPVEEGENRFCCLRIFNGSIFELKEIFIGNSPIHGGVDIVDNSVQWNSDGLVHAYGSPLLGAPAGLNRLGKGSGTSLGLLRTIGGISGFQIVCSGSSTSGGAQYMKVGTYTDAALVQTAAKIPKIPPGKIAKIKRVQITYGKTASGGRAMNAFLVREDATTVQFVSSVTSVAVAGLSAQYDRTISGGILPTFRELSLVLQWQAGSGETSAPVPRSVDVDYEIVNLVGNQ